MTEEFDRGGQRPTVERGYVSCGGFLNRWLTYYVIDGQAVFEGDIVLGPADQILHTPPSASEGLGIVGPHFRWPDGVLPYEIDPDLPDPQRVQDAIAHWHARTPLQFVARTKEASYIRFVPGNGCSSAVGRRGGRQNITLGRVCTAGNAIHEIGHTVGLWHEQSRADRDHYVTVVWSNILSEYAHNFDQHVTDGTDLGTYDYESIMHYPAISFALDPTKPTLIPTDPKAVIGQRTGLSAGDVAAVRAMYPNLTWSS
jgi:hypothetical protein